MRTFAASAFVTWVGAILLASPVLAAGAMTGRVAADASDGSTRVVVTLSAKNKCETRLATGRVEVVCADPVVFDPTDKNVDDGILARWHVEGDRTLVLDTGSGFSRHEAFDLRNPPRLVIDLQGNRRASSAAAPPVYRAAGGSVVVLDPGHGGAENGAVGPSGLMEKEVTLDLARRLEALLERAGMTVILTRDEDRFVPLDDRTSLANHNKAELFVSIHLNASRGTKALGAETYFLSPEASDDDARTAAALENKAYQGGETKPTTEGTTDPALQLILWDLAQNRYLDESSRLAEAVQREMNALVGTRDRGVRQAPFTVLMGATMPAILVEVGFISNAEEEARLKDEAYKDRIAQALARAVAGFRSAEREPAAVTRSPAAIVRRAAHLPVAVVFAVALLTMACSRGDDDGGGRAAKPSSSAPAGDATGAGSNLPGQNADSAAAGSSSGSSPAEMETVTVYFPAADGEKLTGESRSLFKTPQPGDRAKQIVAALIEGPQAEGTVRALPESAELRQLFVLKDGTAWADFSAALRDNIAGGSATEILAVYSIVDSIVLNVPEIVRVGILIEGRPIDTLNGHVDLRRPLKPRHDLVPAPPPPAE